MGCGIATQQQQQYKSHKVEKGETVYSIAQRYGISESACDTDARADKNGIGTNTIIILPNASNVKKPFSAFRRNIMFRKMI